ncbi:MAG: hypothetical protein U9N36_11525, partial [Euryarchaeota archaeon]|nr:hypothetical protein [Euryarchaeota archaeon]
MNMNRSYLRVAIIAIVVMVGTTSAAYAAQLYISGTVLYENNSACNEPSVTIINQVTDESWGVEKNASSNYYWRTIDSNNITIGVTLRFKSMSPDESQSRTTDHIVTQEELDNDTLVHNIKLTDTKPPKIHSVVLTPTVVGPNGSISVAVVATDGAGVAKVTANNTELALVNDTWEGTITAESTSDTYGVTVVATDMYDNVGEHNTETYEVDATAPEINSVELNPTVIAPNGSIIVTVNATDGTGVVSVTANDNELTLVDGTWKGMITAESTSGVHNVTVVATDMYDNVGEHNTETYEVDATAPEINSVELNPTVIAPNRSIIVTVNATDSESDVANVTANGVILDLVNGTWEGAITAESAVGVHNVTVVATDAAGNEDVDNSKTYEVDATPPEINSVELDLTDVASTGLITVTVNATDASGVANVTANGVTLDLVNDTWGGTITAESNAGTYNVTVVATDMVGNEAVDNKTTYTVEEPTETILPEINSVELDLTDVASTGLITVTVNATDASGVANVTANGVTLD